MHGGAPVKNQHSAQIKKSSLDVLPVNPPLADVNRFERVLELAAQSARGISLRWVERPFDNGPQRPPLRACDECGKAFTLAPRSMKFCAHRCRLQTLQRDVLKIVRRQIPRCRGGGQ